MDITYTCKVTRYSVTYHVDGLNAHIRDISTNHNYYKALMVLLARSVRDLIVRGVSYILQEIVEDDWDLMKGNTSWEIMDKVTNGYIIRCEIGDFLSNYHVLVGGMI